MKRIGRLDPIILILALLPLSALAAPSAAEAPAGAPPGVGGTVQEAAKRRERLAAELRKELHPAEKGVFYIKGVRAGDLEETRQTSDFYYLTGLETPGAGVLLFFDESSARERLYLPSRSPSAEKWTGTALGAGGLDPNTLGPDEERIRTMGLTGFDGKGRDVPSGVSEIAEMRSDLSRALHGGAALFLAYDPPGLDEDETPESSLVAEIRARYPQARIASALPALARLRLVKDAGEIAAIRRAVEITCEAERAAMRTLRPGMKEYELEAIVEYVFTRSGARFSAFPTIVGSGPNSCVLHYDRNDRTIESGDLVVVDAGAEYEHYAADVTRTLPASGKFTGEQLRVYRAVLRAQTEAKELVKPGARIRDIHERAVKVLEEEGLKDRVLHGCCHFVGLDVHDTGDREVVLAPGMVLTVEPGAYIPEKNLGVRIEDTFLVTESGYDQLSACVPSLPDEVISEMAKKTEVPDFAPTAGSKR